MDTLKFYWNGIKENGGTLQGASYSDGQLVNHPVGTITIYGKRYRGFSASVHAAFKVENDTDMQTDYFENDRIRVEPSHPLYAQVVVALTAQKAHNAKISAKQAARYGIEQKSA